MAQARGVAVQDHVALAEIELCGELIIAASAAEGERLSAARIDEVLKVAEGHSPRHRPDPGRWADPSRWTGIGRWTDTSTDTDTDTGPGGRSEAGPSA